MMGRSPRKLKVEWLAAGAARYVTEGGDMLDHLCWRHYGRDWAVPELVLRANPGLAGHGAALPAGLTILLPPPPPAAAAKKLRRLFD